MSRVPKTKQGLTIGASRGHGKPMNTERTMEFILKQQATFEANFAKADQRFLKTDQRFLKAEKRLDRIERVVGQFASASLRFRNEIRRSQIEADRQLKALRELNYQTEDKLNALIDVVDKSIRRNGKRGGQ